MKNKVLNIEFGSRLKELRYNLPKRDGNIVFQREVAKEAKISVSSYQQAEKGFMPGRSILTALSEYFNVPKKYLEKGQVDHVPKETSLYQGIKSELQDGEGLWGKTHLHEVEGTHLTITEFDPKEGQIKGPLRAAIEGLGEIFDSGDQILTQAIQANIRAFQLSARRERQNAQQVREIKALQNKYDELKKRFDAHEKTCSPNSSSSPAGDNTERKVI